MATLADLLKQAKTLKPAQATPTPSANPSVAPMAPTPPASNIPVAPAASGFAAWKVPAPAAKVGHGSDILHGTGFTRKIADAQTKAIERSNLELAKEQAAINPLLALEAKHKLEAKVSEADTGKLDAAIVGLQQANIVSTFEYDADQARAVTEGAKQRYFCLIGAAGTGKTKTTNEVIQSIKSSIATIDLNKTRVKYKKVTKLSKEEKAAAKLAKKAGMEMESMEEDTPEPEAPYEPEYNTAICFCAFTGRAVQQMKRAIPIEYHPMCNTIHATLGYMPEYYDDISINENGVEEMKTKMRFRPTFTAARKLAYQVYIIDEAGMCPIQLWNELIDAAPEGARFILIGDINQLPPVQGRSVLGFAMTKWPTYELRKIHRQAADNPIIANAHKILNGFIPAKFPGQFDILTTEQGSEGTLQALLGVIKKLHQAGQFDPFRDAIIVPQNKDTLGQLYVNERLMDYFNPEREENGVVLNKRVLIQTGMTTVACAVGDKVMLLQNDRELNLTNGMMGVITEININGDYNPTRGGPVHTGPSMDELNFEEVDLASAVDELTKDKKESKEDVQRQASHITTIRFGDDTEVKFSTGGQYRKFTLGYAFTCHKSQGGEYPTVIILCHSTNIRMLTREWLYTAVTRARNRVILLCNSRGLLSAVKTQTIKGSTLAEKVACFNKLQADIPDLTVPYLPEPELLVDVKVEAAQ